VPTWAIVLVIVLTVICGVTVFICAGGILVGFRMFSVGTPDTSREFTEATGLEYPESARAFYSYDDHTGPFGDGEGHLVLEVDKGTINKWLTESPPWDAEQWRSGPVASEIAGNCLVRHGNSELNRLMNSPDTRYVALDVGPPALSWHNGRLLLIDSATSKVWLFVWNN
jgi:hypothetical protein